MQGSYKRHSYLHSISQEKRLSCKDLKREMVILQGSYKRDGYVAMILQEKWLSCKDPGLNFSAQIDVRVGLQWEDF